MPIAGALWFLMALFWAEVMFFAIEYFAKNEMFKALLIVFIALFGNLNAYILPFTLPLAIGQACVGVGFMYLGKMMRKYYNQPIIVYLLNLKYFHWLLMAIGTTILIFLNGYVNMRKQYYSIIPLFWIDAFLAIIVGLNLGNLLIKVFGQI